MRKKRAFKHSFDTIHSDKHAVASERLPAISTLITLLILFTSPTNPVFGLNEETPLAMVEALKERSARIEQREMELKEREGRLHLLEEEIRAMIKGYTKLKEEVDRKEADRLSVRNQEKEKRIARLAKIFQSMPPREAANRIAKLKESTALALLRRIKEKNAAKILSNLSPTKAAKFSEKFIKVPK
ncbi:hypothetical protein JYT87_00295 [Nitrospira defluvii]|nr:hypothetical protein [Nitrospira defluvii]